MNDGGWTEANVIAAAVRILGGAQKVADSLGVSRSQVYRWIKARSMARATYVHVAKLASLSGIDTGFLGGDGLPSPGIKESHGKPPLLPVKQGSVQAPKGNGAHPVRTRRHGEKLAGSKQSPNGAIKSNGPQASDRYTCGEEAGRNEAQKGGTLQTCVIQSNGVAPSGGDHFGRRKTLRTKGQEESREHQP